MILSILNPKGGAGKTTLAVNLARAFQDLGRSVLLVDTDPQGSARDWHAANSDNPVDLVALDRPGGLRTLRNLSTNGYDLLLLDGAARLEDLVAATVRVADWVLIPLQPSPYDVWAVTDLVELISARQEVTNGQPGARFVISRQITGARLSRDVRRALAEYPSVPLLTASMAQRQIYPQTAASGRSVFDHGGDAAGRAQSEISAIARELLSAITQSVEPVEEEEVK